jgi:hypothetical protein
VRHQASKVRQSRRPPRYTGPCPSGCVPRRCCTRPNSRAVERGACRGDSLCGLSEPGVRTAGLWTGATPRRHRRPRRPAHARLACTGIASCRCSQLFVAASGNWPREFRMRQRGDDLPLSPRPAAWRSAVTLPFRLWVIHDPSTSRRCGELVNIARDAITCAIGLH